jgi:orotate phosphoribosyltransferase
MPEATLTPVAGPEAATAVAGALLESGCVNVRPASPVTFTSGMRAPVYVDNRRLIFHPGPWHVVVDALVAGVRAEVPPAEVVAGVESAGIPHSSAVAFTAGLPSVFVRKGEREHGMGRRIEGGDVAGRRVILVEDMITTGGSSLAAVEVLRAADAKVARCLAIVSYGFEEGLDAFETAGVALGVLTTFEVVLDVAVVSGRVDEAAASSVRDWLADPHGWQA